MIDEQNFRKYLTQHEIEALIPGLAQTIDADYEGKSVVLVGLLKGTFVFMADLIRTLKINPEVDFVRLTKQHTRLGESGTITIVKDLTTDIRGKHVLIVEEIIDSGRTLKFLCDRIQQAQPASVQIVTLLDKPHRRREELPVKYVGKTIDDVFLVGYGLDLEEQCRNLPDLYYLKYPN